MSDLFSASKNADGFEIWADSKNEWRWRFWSKGNITAESGESYKNSADCRSALDNFVKTAATANLRTTLKIG